MEANDPAATLAIFGWLSAALLLLVFVICFVAGRGSLALNHVIGLRVPALMRDEVSWQAGHAAGRMPALACFVLAVAFDLVGLAWRLASVGAIAAFIVGLVWITVRASRAANLGRN